MTITGTITAMVTPFGEDGAVDFARLAEFVDWQCESGVDGLCPVGTTGESPTLDYAEHQKVIEETIKYAKGRVKIIAGTGANSTAEAVSLTKAAIAMGGADACLQVTPYYNKPNAEGLYRHFMTVADLGLPVVLYNVPGRSGREIPLDVVERLSAHPMVVAIKEAAGSVERVSAIKARCPALTVLSGDDSLALPMIAVGASGVISVASDVMPKEISEFIRTALSGDMTKARELHLKYYRLFHDLFIDTNPVMVKEALAMMGRIDPVYRLPLCETTAENRARLSDTLKELGVLK